MSKLSFPVVCEKIELTANITTFHFVTDYDLVEHAEGSIGMKFYSIGEESDFTNLEVGDRLTVTVVIDED